MIQKNELDFTPSVKLGPIIGDINLKKKKKKIDVPVGPKLAMPAFHKQVLF